MKKYHYVVATGSLVFFLSLTGCSSDQETDNAQIQSDISPVISKVGGSVSEIRVQDNQRVKKGDTLVILDDRDLALQVQQATIALEQAEANVKLAEKNSKVSEISTVTASDNSSTAQAIVARAKENVRASEIRLKQATLNFERQSTLLADKATPKQAFDNAKSDKESAESQLKAAQAEVNVLLQQVKVTQKGILSAKSQAGVALQNIMMAKLGVEQARTALANAKLQHSYTVIKAPTNGIVSDKNVQIGQVVAVGQPLMKVADADNVWVVANYKETQVGQMKVGAQAEVLIDAYPDKTFKAEVSSISPATGARFALLPPDNATGNFVKVTQRVPVKIKFVETIEASTLLRAGMSVSVTVK